MRLYVHLPFCASKCAYCAFFSLPAPSPQQVEKTVDRLISQCRKASGGLPPLESVFIGGGTPTYLSPKQLHSLLSGISVLVQAEGCEFSIECNPESLTPEKADVLRESGVNRVSMGVQTLNPALRKILGRTGDPLAVFSAVGMLRRAGIFNLNADLIYAIPSQTEANFRDDLSRLMDLGLSHLSAYSLTADEGSRLAGHFSETETESLSLQIWEELPDWLLPYGLKRYEISNYAVPGRECRHNLGIWLGDHYVGIGPSASSFDGTLRTTEAPNLEAWLNSESPEIDALSPDARANEILAFGLRTVQGWTSERLRSATGYPLAHWQAKLAPLLEENLLILNESRLTPSEKGLSFWNYIAETLL